MLWSGWVNLLMASDEWKKCEYREQMKLLFVVKTYFYLHTIRNNTTTQHHNKMTEISNNKDYSTTTISILGTGWLGLPLGRYLRLKGYEVKGSTTSPKKIHTIVHNDVRPYLIQIDDRVVGENGEDFFNTDILIVTIPPTREFDRYITTMKVVVEQIKQHNIPKVLYTSSTGVYGKQAGLLNETALLQPTSVTSRAVVEAEAILKTAEKDLTILRLAGLVGGNRKAGRFFAGKKNLPSGNAPVNLVHQEDCIQIMDQIIEGEYWNETFNVCADVHPPKHVFYRMQAMKHQFVLPEFAPDDKTAKDYKIVDNTKLKEKLNYSYLYPDPMVF